MGFQPVVALAQIERLADSCLPKILMMTHAMEGGVARHIAELSFSVAGKALVFQLRTRLSSVKEVCLVLPAALAGEHEVHMVFRWPEQQASLWGALARLGITQFHVHHVLNWPQGFWTNFLSRKIPYDLTLHDHCIFASLSSEESAYRADAGLIRVQRCLGRDALAASKDLVRLMSSARRTWVPSHNLYDNVVQYFPGLDINLQYQPHPEAELNGAYPHPVLRKLAEGQSLRIVCLGMLSVEKGAQVLAGVARQAAKESLPLEFHLLGSCHVQLPQNIRRHGSYKDSQLPALLASIEPHVLWLPAQCPETWSYTLSAGLKAGLPIIATNLGVFPERLKNRPLSWLCDPDISVAQWLGVLSSVYDKHRLEPERSYRWHTPCVRAFYTAEHGYILENYDTLPGGYSQLTDQELKQALILGLPEPENWRSYLLQLLVRLKHSSLLAPLVRLIPYRWQRKVKRLISRGPLHEPPR